MRKTAAHNGILLKDGRTFEQFSQVDTVVFDKTGTLTEDQPHVGRIHACHGYTEDEIVRLAAAVATNQHHPNQDGALEREVSTRLEAEQPLMAL